MSLLGTGFYQVSFIGLLKTPEIEYNESVASKYWGLHNIMGQKLFWNRNGIFYESTISRVIF